MSTPTLEDFPDGSWIDKWGSCRVCGGEIPYGHTSNCDFHKLEQDLAKERAANAELNAASEALREYLLTEMYSTQADIPDAIWNRFCEAIKPSNEIFGKECE